VKRITINVPEVSGPDTHDGEMLTMSVDERGNLVISDRTGEGTPGNNYAYRTLAIYAGGFWADAQMEDLED